MLRDTAGEEDKHEQSPLIIDRAVLAGWTFLVFKIKKAVNRKINSLMQYPKGVQYREKMILKFEYKYKKIRYENNFVLSYVFKFKIIFLCFWLPFGYPE